MRNIKNPAVLLLAIASSATAFSAHPPFAKVSLKLLDQPCVVLHGTEEDIETLKKDFSDLLSDLQTKKDEASVEDVAATLVEKAIKMTGAQRDVEAKHIDDAHAAVLEALGDEERAESLAAEAHDEGLAAEKMGTLIESMDNEYDNVERKRDFSVAHAAHHMEHDAKVLFEEAKKKELNARDEEEEAERCLEQLERNEAELKATMEQLRTLKADKAVNQWKEAKE